MHVVRLRKKMHVDLSVDLTCWSHLRPTHVAVSFVAADFDGPVRAPMHRRYHESLQNLTPADVYFGRAQTILLERERIKRDTIRQRRLQYQLKAA